MTESSETEVPRPDEEGTEGGGAAEPPAEAPAPDEGGDTSPDDPAEGGDEAPTG